MSTTSDLPEPSLSDKVTTITRPPPTCSRKVPKIKALAWLDKLLALWIILAMGIGIILGYFVPNTSVVLEKVKFVDVSLPLGSSLFLFTIRMIKLIIDFMKYTAIALIVMMWPILCRVSPSALLRLFSGAKIWYHLLFSLVVNWVFAPLLMLALSWAFLPDKEGLREGLILVGIARCIAMVLVWTDIADGDADFCAVLVAFNSILQIVLYAPFAILYINKISPGGGSGGVVVGYGTVARSVAAFLGIPLAAALVTRGAFILFKAQLFFQEKFLPTIAPLSLIALLFTTLIIFAAQGRQVVDSITSVLRVVAPLLVYFLIMFFLVLFTCKRAKVSYGRTTAQAFTGASNNFELAIAVAVSAYGANSPQALAATVGPLVEVPVLLGLAYLLNWYRKRQNWDLDEEEVAQNTAGSSKEAV
ncbi:arsenite transporter, partial [Phenoliferia sp. Uapishka_3]